MYKFLFKALIVAVGVVIGNIATQRITQREE